MKKIILLSFIIVSSYILFFTNLLDISFKCKVNQLSEIECKTHYAWTDCFMTSIIPTENGVDIIKYTPVPFFMIHEFCKGVL